MSSPYLRPSALLPWFTFVWVPLLAGLFASPASAQGHEAAASPSPLPLLLGAGVAGIVLGAALGMGLKKAPSAPVVAASERDYVFDEASAPLSVVDSKERFVRVNGAWEALLQTEGAGGRGFISLVHPDDAPDVRAGVLSVFEGETRLFERETRLFRPDESLVTARLSARAQGDKKKPDTVLLGLLDVGELVEAKRELAGARAAIRSLYEVMAGDKTANLDAKIKSLLAMGCGRLELPIAALSRRVRAEDGGDALETLFVQSPDRRVRPALVLRRGDTSPEGRLLGLDVLPLAGEWRESPCVAAGEALTFLGAPVEVGGAWFGWLSFASLETGRSGFEASEVELLGLMAQWVGNEIEREEARREVQQTQYEVLAANQKLESLATVDPLTEVKNRRAFGDKLLEEWSRATRYNTPLSLVLLDIDTETDITATSDAAVKHVACVVGDAIRNTDFLARYCGGQFALLLPNTEGEGACVLAERLRSRLEQSAPATGALTASVGVASLDTEMKKAEDLLHAAQEALSAGQERGPNRVTRAHELVGAAL